MHARNVYLLINLVTGCVSPQYHFPFDNFFQTMRHCAPDVSGTICWQQLANLEVSMPKQHRVISLEIPSEEESHTMSKHIFEPNTYDTTSDDYSVSDVAF
jgi:hypothetical protein